MRIKNTVAVIVTALALVTAGCSGGDEEFNKADVAFAQQMIPHHKQATEMSALTDGRSDNPEVLTLAQEITDAQGPEIETMTSWLESWDQAVPSGMGGMDSMPGMMSDQQISDLRDSSGADFDEQFLTMMIEHHEGAIMMAKSEQTEGQYEPAIDLAREIESSQAAEITTMSSLLS